jgi:hypothetical protein
MSPVAMTISANMRTGRPKGCPTPKSAPSRRRFSLTFLTSRARGLHQHPPSNGPRSQLTQIASSPGSLSAFDGGPEDYMEGRGCIVFLDMPPTSLVGPRKVPCRL